ncbi:MarR family winged helix-turn-helix transcriptional regulator [Pseudohongiella sp.]|uniref:HTH marR-type domain-containing protein n=1 Tax=marine sediment metagenome TaxID=412755 RepID=A0A0F9YVX8_9ZZZZ|nr:MarR family transcriptional regulator [Pseudohongiella sp.]
MATSSQSELILKLVALHTKIQKQIAGPLSFHGISFTEYLVLRQLHAAPENKMRRIDLAQQVGLSASGVTRLLNPMEKVGLISKEEAPRDARVSLVTITSAGETIFSDADASFAQVAQSVMQSLSGEDQKSLSRLTGLLL